MKRTAQRIEEAKARKGSAADQRTKSKAAQPENSVKTRRRGNPDKLKPFQFPKGVSGNPGGRPKNDFAAILARAVIEGNMQEAYQAFALQLRKGNAYALNVLADRGYGKVKDRVALENPDGTPLAITVRFVKGTLKEMAK